MRMRLQNHRRWSLLVVSSFVPRFRISVSDWTFNVKLYTWVTKKTGQNPSKSHLIRPLLNYDIRPWSGCRSPCPFLAFNYKFTLILQLIWMCRYFGIRVTDIEVPSHCLPTVTPALPEESRPLLLSVSRPHWGCWAICIMSVVSDTRKLW